MRALSIVAFLFILITLNGQNTWSVEVSSLHYISYRDLHNVPKMPWAVFPRQKEIAAYRPGLGFSLLKQVSPKLQLKFGARFADKGYNTHQWDAFWGIEIIDGKIYERRSKVQEIYHFSYLDIPIGLRYQPAPDRKWSWYMDLSLMPGYYLGTHKIKHLDVETKSRFRDESFRPFQLGLNAGVGISFRLNDHLSLFAQPSIYYNITRLRNTGDKENLMGAGIEIGCRYRF